MPRFGRSVPDDTRPDASRRYTLADVTSYLESNPGADFFTVMEFGPDPYTGPRGQACSFQPVASKKDPRPRRFSEEVAVKLEEVDTERKPRSSTLGRSIGKRWGKPNAEDIYDWTHTPGLFVLPGYSQTRLDTGRNISHENLVL